ncbi:MAG: hypothetical protein KDB88_13855, partial [Flavobacteriales bacterium]|nr:hypothetical protein [Flavobacteriales bacterium]
VRNTGGWGADPVSKDIGLYVSEVSGQTDAHSNLAALLNGNVVVGDRGGQVVGSGGQRVLALQNGVAPSGPPSSGSGLPDGGVQLFSEVDLTGVSVLTVMNGDGQVVKMYREAALTPGDSAPLAPTYDASVIDVLDNMRTRINELEARLQALGLLE